MGQFLPKTKYPFEQPPWPLYGAMLKDVIKKTFRGLWGSIKSITTLRWYHVVLPPLGAYHIGYAFIHDFWMLDPILPRKDDRDFFDRWVETVDSPTPDQLQTRPKGRLWMPLMTRDMAHRGIAVPGLSLFEHTYMFTVLTLQLATYSTWRCAQYIFNFGRYKRSVTWDPKENYKAFINTSMSAWYEPDTTSEKDANGDHILGSFTFYNMMYAEHQTTIMHASTAEFQVNNETREVTKLILTTKGNKDMNIEPVVYTSTDPVEISQTAVYVGASGCHAQVHWWANGVNEVKQWPLHHRSHLWTQFFNWAGLNQSYFFMRADQKADNQILLNNVLQGFPVHNGIPKSIAEWDGAVVHHMARDARKELTEYFLKIGKPISPSQMNALLAATIFHSADHYYLDKHSAVAGVNPIFKTDNTVLRLTIVAGYNWLFPKFKVSQFKDTDDVCRILYNCANRYDPEFANGLLTMGIAI